MSNIYIANDRKYRVEDEHVQSFLQDHPNAEIEEKEPEQLTKYYGEGGKVFKVSAEHLDAFKTEHSDFYTREEIETGMSANKAALKKQKEEQEALAAERETKINELWESQYHLTKFSDKFRKGNRWTDDEIKAVNEHVANMSSEDKYKALLEWDTEAVEVAIGGGEDVGVVEELGDIIGNSFNWWTNLLTGAFDEGATLEDTFKNATEQQALSYKQDEREYQLRRLGEGTAGKNAFIERTAEIEKEILELQNQQKGLEKESEEYLQLENNIKNLEADKPSLFNVSEVKQVEDFFDAYDNMVGASFQLGRDGEGVDFLGESYNENFLTLEEFEAAGWNPDQYETFKANNDINKDMFKLDDLMKSTKAWHGIDENGEIIQLLERNNLTLDDLKNYKVKGGGHRFANLFKSERDKLAKTYNDDLKSQGFVKNTWFDDAYFKTVFPEITDEEVKMIQGESMTVGVSKPAREQFNQYITGVENLVTNVRGNQQFLFGDAFLSEDEIKEDEAAEDKQRQEIFDKIDLGYRNAIGEDPVVRRIISDLVKENRGTLDQYKKDLIKQYPLTTKANVDKVNELMQKKQDELIIGGLAKNKEYKKRATEIGAVFGDITQKYNIDFTRQQSGFTRFMDNIAYDREDFDWYNPLEWLGETTNAFAGGVEGITSSIGDHAMASFSGFMSRNKDKKVQSLEAAIEAGEILETDKVVWDAIQQKWMKSDDQENSQWFSAEGALKNMQKKKNYWDDSIVKQMQEAERSNKRIESYGSADYTDGISLQDVFRTVGQTLPHIGMAAAHTIAAPWTGGVGLAHTILMYTGTAAMGLQMYGDNYHSAIERNLKNNKLDEASIRKAHPDWTNVQVEEEYKKNLIENYESGEGANIATAAAMAAAQTALERWGAEQMVGSLQKSLGVAPGGVAGIQWKDFTFNKLWGATWDDVGSGLYRLAINRGGDGLKEFGTEYMQEILGMMSEGMQAGEGKMKYVDYDAALQAGIGGMISGMAIPFAGDITTMSRIQLREAAANIALKYAPNTKYAGNVKVTNEWYKNSQKQLDDDLGTGLIDKKEYYDRSKMLAASRNASLQLGLLGGQDGFTKNMSNENRSALLDLYTDMNILGQEIENAKGNDPLQKALKEESKILTERAQEIISQERLLEKGRQELGRKNREGTTGASILPLNIKGTKPSTPQVTNIEARKSLELENEARANPHYKGPGKGQAIRIDQNNINKRKAEMQIAKDQIAAKQETNLVTPDQISDQEAINLLKGWDEGTIDPNTPDADMPLNTRERINEAKKMIADTQNAMADVNMEADTATAGEMEGVNEVLLNTIKDPKTSKADKNKSIDALINNNKNLYLAAIGYSPEAGTISAKALVDAIKSRLGPLIKNFDASKGAKWSTYVTESLRRKKAEIYDEAAIGQGTDLRIDDNTKQIADEADKDFDEKAEESDLRKKETVSNNPVIQDAIDDMEHEGDSEGKEGIKDQAKKTIEILANKGKTAEEIGDALHNEANDTTWKAIKGKMTLASQAYKDFINKLFDSNFVKNISAYDMKNRWEGLFPRKETGTTPTTSSKKGSFAKQIFEITIPLKQKLKDYFLDGNTDRYTKRAKSLFQFIARDVTLESLNELKVDKDFMESLTRILKEQNSTLTAEEFMNAIEYKLDRRNLEDTSFDKIVNEKPRKKATKEKVDDIIGEETTKVRANKQAEAEGLTPWSKLTIKKKINLIWEMADAMQTEGLDLARFFVATNFTQMADPANAALATEQLAIADILGILKNPKITEERKNQIKKLVEEGKILDLKQLKKELVSDKDGKLTKAEAAAISPTDRNLPPKNKRTKKDVVDKVKINNNKLDLINKGKKEIYNKLRQVIIKNPHLIPAINYLLYRVNNNDSFGRTMAPLLGYINEPGFNYKETIGEHAFQYNNLSTLFIEASLSLSDTEFDQFLDFLNESYVQIQLPDSGPQDNSYKNVEDKFTGEKLPNIDLKSDVLPLLKTHILEALRGERKWSEVGSSLLRYFNGYGYYNPNTFMWKGKTAADQFGAKVPIKYREVSKKDGKPIYPNVVKLQAYAVSQVLAGNWTTKFAQEMVNAGLQTAIDAGKANLLIQEIIPGILEKKCESPCRVPRTSRQVKKTLENSLDTQVNAQKVNKKRKGISVFDFDDTLAKTKEQVLVAMPDGTLRRLTPAQFAEQAGILTEQGAEFDFSQFEDVKGAKKGPLADLALKRQGKFGSGDIFILTARPQTSAKGIKTFLDGIGLNIPIENITGLEDGTSQAKADWVLSKTQEGYNDFYFADDSKMNVDAVKQILDQVDVKSEVQQAIADKETSLDKEFNEMLEETEGVKSQAEYSRTRAQLEGKAKDKGFFKWLGNQLTITPSAEDFLGLMYDLMGIGKQGNRHATWIQDNLIKPYNKAEQSILSAKVTVANDFAALKKAFPSLKSSLLNNPLMDQIGVGPYTKSQAIRVYMWAKQGMEIPGLSKRDQNALVAAVENDAELMSFADNVILIQKDKQYPAPGNEWVAGTIDGDLMSNIDKTFRRKVMTEFDENTKIIFSEKNMNKLEAIYGKKWVDALKDSLRRMKSGSNRPVYQGGGSRMVNEMLDWLNGSVGAVMFINMKSGLLQLISNVNFINWGDNNIYAAAKAFASAEYWPTVVKLMNSDYLVNRRDGLKINVNEAELANAAKDRGMKGAIAYLLDKGFIITRIMDSLAIATGGATFYINRTKALLQRQNPETGKKYTQAEAEAKAFDDFYAISEETQQSSNPSKISQQQASLAGRVILSFQNVTMQYNRKTKKSIRDLYNRRKKPGMTQRESDLSNISSIIYYTTVQNLIFNALQQALFALAFDDEADEKEKNRAANIANGMIDSLLFGMGFGGAAISTVKNILRVVQYERGQKSPDYEEAVWEIFNISPVLDSKVRKLRTTARTFNWNREEIAKRGWSLDNPAYLAISQLISAATNIPIDRVLRKTMNLRAAMDEETRAWQTVALILGWSTWSVGLPYWGLQSTIDQEEIAIEKAKKDYKNDVRKIKAQGYKKVMYRNLKDFDPKDIIELQSPAGTVIYYVKVGKGKQAKN